MPPPVITNPSAPFGGDHKPSSICTAVDSAVSCCGTGGPAPETSKSKPVTARIAKLTSAASHSRASGDGDLQAHGQSSPSADADPHGEDFGLDWGPHGSAEGALEAFLRQHHQQVAERLGSWMAEERRLLTAHLGHHVPAALVQGRWPSDTVQLHRKEPPGPVQEHRSRAKTQGSRRSSRSDRSQFSSACSSGLRDGSDSLGVSVAAGKTARRRRLSHHSTNFHQELELEEQGMQSIWSRAPTDEDTRQIERKVFDLQRQSKSPSVLKVGSSFRRCVQKVVYSRTFEAVAAIMILFNTAFMGVEVELEASEGVQVIPGYIRIINYVFTMIFSIELLMRLVALGWKVCQEEHRLWIVFDAFLVLTGLFDMIAGIFASISGGSTAEFGTARMMRVIRITRMIRVLRFVRLVQFIRALRVLIFSIVTTLKSVVWALVLLFIVIYCFALVFTQAAADSRDMDPAVEIAAERYWGDLGTSVLTLLEAITGGLDWEDPLKALTRIHWVWMLTFIGFILFTYFAILNVMTAAFCQGAVEGKLYDRDATVRDLIMNKKSGLHKTTDLFKNMFDQIDTNENGEVSWPEFKEHLNDEPVQALLALLELGESDLWVLFQILDTDGSQRLDAHEFMQGCLRLKGAARSIDLAKLSFENQRLSDLLTLFMGFVRDELGSLKILAGGLPRDPLIESTVV